MAIDPVQTIDRSGEETPQTFEEFFRRVYVRLAQGLLLLTGDRTEAEDLAQEALARAYERWERVRAMESPEGYVYRTAMNLNRKRLRRLSVGRRRAPTAEQQDGLEAAEARADVLRLLASLPDGQREALVLVEWLGLTADEAGAVLGIDGASVRGRIHRARSRLRGAETHD